MPLSCVSHEIKERSQEVCLYSGLGEVVRSAVESIRQTAALWAASGNRSSRALSDRTMYNIVPNQRIPSVSFNSVAQLHNLYTIHKSLSVNESRVVRLKVVSRMLRLSLSGTATSQPGWCSLWVAQLQASLADVASEWHSYKPAWLM